MVYVVVFYMGGVRSVAVFSNIDSAQDFSRNVSGEIFLETIDRFEYK